MKIYSTIVWRTVCEFFVVSRALIIHLKNYVEERGAKVGDGKNAEARIADKISCLVFKTKV